MRLHSLAEESNVLLEEWRAPTTPWKNLAPTTSPAGYLRIGSYSAHMCIYFPLMDHTPHYLVREQVESGDSVCVCMRAEHSCMCGWPCWHIPMLSLATAWTEEHRVMAAWPLSGRQVCQSITSINLLNVIRLLLTWKAMQYGNSKVFTMFSK